MTSLSSVKGTKIMSDKKMEEFFVPVPYDDKKRKVEFICIIIYISLCRESVSFLLNSVYKDFGRYIKYS